MLELKNITKVYELGKPKDKNYQTVSALKGVSVTFRDNEFVSILGPSGCGKTTLLNIIGGLDHYTDGDLVINNVSTKEYNDRDWDNYRNHKIGFIFQSYNLIPHQTILENVELALTLSGVSKTERKKKAKDALVKVGLGDKINAKPSQLSGGQMQRVAIARAIVNNPDIILADEPTGALDTQTSIQVMDILKEIAKEKLIIMVTHNPQIAETYSTRIIKLLDGKIIDDNRPFNENERVIVEKLEPKKEKTEMSYLTALSLSGKNLLTKKARTALVSFAGSIGIIGISLILSLSSGFQSYINDVQKDTLSTYPLTVQKDVVDISSVLQAMMDKGNDSYEIDEDGNVHANTQMVEMFNGILKDSSTNNLKEFKKYIDENDSIFSSYTINYTYNVDLNIYDGNNNLLNPSTVFTDLLAEIVRASGGTGDASMYMASANMLNRPAFSEMLNNNELLENQYDLVGDKSRWPSNYDECVLVINENNTINDYYLYALGLVESPTLQDIANGIVNDENYEIEIDPISFEKLLDTKFKVLLDTDYYEEQSDETYLDKRKDNSFINNQLNNSSVGIEMKIVGIVKPNGDAVAHSIDAPIGYSSKLVEEIINRTNNSSIVKKQIENPTIDVLTGEAFPSQTLTSSEKRDAIVNEINDLSHQELVMKLRATDYWNIFESYENDETMLRQVLISSIDRLDEKGIGSMYSAFFGENTYNDNIVNFGVKDLNDPSTISFYCSDFESKDTLKAEIDKYNEFIKAEKGDDYIISYSDYVALMMSSVSVIINAISYVLIAFVSVSLVVSSIMIGIITYISVFERTKEIGILRSIGASKKNIKSVFTAESLIIGFISGLIGIGVTVLLCFPINAIINALAGIGNVAKLPLDGAIMLLLLSCLLTFVAGLIPSRIASKKDPVVALRSE